jgi:hypothetical protein
MQLVNIRNNQHNDVTEFLLTAARMFRTEPKGANDSPCCGSPVQEPPEGQAHYVVIYHGEQYYGGPEEGGWYGWDYVWTGYAVFASKDEATKARDWIERAMNPWNDELVQQRNEALASEYEALVARDPSADFDGPDDDESGCFESYSVSVQETKPEDSFGSRHYE